jgi:hypothetical protein
MLLIVFVSNTGDKLKVDAEVVARLTQRAGDVPARIHCPCQNTDHRPPRRVRSERRRPHARTGGTVTDTQRVNIGKQHPSAYKALLALSAEVEEAAAAAGLDPLLIELLRIRTSQINGCGVPVEGDGTAP